MGKEFRHDDKYFKLKPKPVPMPTLPTNKPPKPSKDETRPRESGGKNAPQNQ
jgi:hypothetical protein